MWHWMQFPASTTTKTGRHDIAEILLKVVLNTKIKSNVKIINFKNFFKYQIVIIVQLRTDGQMCFSMDFVLAIQHSILCHNRLPFNLQSCARTHAVLVIGLYELLGNPFT
jgi:hypothetical protein